MGHGSVIFVISVAQFFVIFVISVAQLLRDLCDLRG